MINLRGQCNSDTRYKLRLLFLSVLSAKHFKSSDLHKQTNKQTKKKDKMFYISTQRSYGLRYCGNKKHEFYFENLPTVL